MPNIKSELLQYTKRNNINSDDAQLHSCISKEVGHISISSFNKFEDLVLRISKREVGSLGRDEFINILNKLRFATKVVEPASQKLQRGEYNRNNNILKCKLEVFGYKDIKVVNFLKQFDIDVQNCIGMNQIHGNHIIIAKGKDKGKFFLETDGIITTEPGIFLIVKTADCLPVFFYEPYKKIIGVAHLGWKGIFLDLGSKMIEKMVKLGARRADIYIGTGPFIHSCCYSVSKERVAKFQDKYGNDSKIYVQKEGMYYLDLQYLLQKQLIKTGCDPNRIEFSNICTSCSNNDFFSCRKGDKDNVILGIIGRRSNGRKY